MRRVCHNAFDIALVVFARHRAAPIERNVTRCVRPYLRCARFRRVAQIDDSRKFFVFDRDQFGSVLRRRQRFGNDRNDRFADKVNLLAREREAEWVDDFGAATAGHGRMLQHGSECG